MQKHVNCGAFGSVDKKTFHIVRMNIQKSLRVSGDELLDANRNLVHRHALGNPHARLFGCIAKTLSVDLHNFGCHHNGSISMMD